MLKNGTTGGSRAAVDTSLLALSLFVIALAALVFFIHHSAMISDTPGTKVAEQMAYGKISEVDMHEILEKAYLKASQDAGAAGAAAQVDVDILFSQYATQWLQSYFQERGIYNVNVSITTSAVPEEMEKSYGTTTVLNYGRYVVTISTS
jgi:hypothetical protein